MPSDRPTTMILRFRDLVTSPGDTVANHNEISLSKGCVWWGWWNKSGETVPDDVFRDLNVRAKEPDGLRVLLLDSGRDLLFSSVCKGLAWDREHKRMPSPTAALTPDYYSRQEYLAWFQLGEIAPIPEESLQQYTYVRVD